MNEPQHGAEQLPAELLWAEGHHASDVVLTALADGQDAIVPAVVRLHVEHCAACTAQLGHAALLSLHAARELGTGARVRRPVPRVAVALGLVAAVIGFLPVLLESSFTQELSLLTRGLAALTARLDGGARTTLGIAVTYVAATALVIMGLALARLSPKKEVSR